MPARDTARIVHCDVDAFFASVEQCLDPCLRGRPVLVGRGVVASASYEAKACGVKTAMTIRRALALCPNAVLVAGRYEHYADFAARLRRLLDDFTPAVEQAALDDFYLDLTGTDRLYPDFPAALRRLQQRVEDSLGLTVSLGAATNKTVASIASRLDRPRGFAIVPAGEEAKFLAPLPIAKLPGIGHVHEEMLHERGITTLGQLRELPLAVLTATFGKVIGAELHDRAHGRDPREVREPPVPKSVSRETTVEHGTIDLDFLHGLLGYLAERVAATLRQLHRQARTLTLKIRYTDFISAHRATRLRPPTNDDKQLLGTALETLQGLYARRVALRFVGVAASNLEPECLENDLFDIRANRRWYLNRSIDAVRHRFGWNAVSYADGLELRAHYEMHRNGLVLSTPCLSR